MMRHLMTAACAALIGLCISGRANANALDDGAARYRAITIVSIGQALDGARALRDHAAAGDLVGATPSLDRGPGRVGAFRGLHSRAGPRARRADRRMAERRPAAFISSRRACSALAAPTSRPMPMRWSRISTRSIANSTTCRCQPQGLLAGTVRLAYEVGESKADGGESRISGTSLDDMRNNVVGIDVAYRTIFADPLRAADPACANLVTDQIARLQGGGISA